MIHVGDILYQRLRRRVDIAENHAKRHFIEEYMLTVEQYQHALEVLGKSYQILSALYTHYKLIIKSLEKDTVKNQVQAFEFVDDTLKLENKAQDTELESQKSLLEQMKTRIRWQKHMYEFYVKRLQIIEQACVDEFDMEYRFQFKQLSSYMTYIERSAIDSAQWLKNNVRKLQDGHHKVSELLPTERYDMAEVYRLCYAALKIKEDLIIDFKINENNISNIIPFKRNLNNR